jgi:hypothetical protein
MEALAKSTSGVMISNTSDGVCQAKCANETYIKIDGECIEPSAIPENGTEGYCAQEADCVTCSLLSDCIWTDGTCVNGWGKALRSTDEVERSQILGLMTLPEKLRSRVTCRNKTALNGDDLPVCPFIGSQLTIFDGSLYSLSVEVDKGTVCTYRAGRTVYPQVLTCEFISQMEVEGTYDAIEVHVQYCQDWSRLTGHGRCDVIQIPLNHMESFVVNMSEFTLTITFKEKVTALPSYLIRYVCTDTVPRIEVWDLLKPLFFLFFMMFVLLMANRIVQRVYMWITGQVPVVQIQMQQLEAENPSFEVLLMDGHVQPDIKKDGIDLDFGQDSCCFCLELYRDNDMLARLRCKHVFHRTCFEHWLTVSATVLKCPVCSVKIIPDNSEST